MPLEAVALAVSARLVIGRRGHAWRFHAMTEDIMGLSGSTVNAVSVDASNPIAPPPGTGITGGTKRQCEVEGGGIDWLDVTLYGAWPLESWAGLRAEWDKQRGLVEAGNEGDGIYVAPDGQRLFLEPYGVTKGVRCRWVFKWRGCRFYVVDRAAPDDNFGNVFVEIPGEACLGGGAYELWLAALELLKSMGFDCHRDVVGRLDVCADLPGVAIGEFASAFHEGRIVRRAKRWKLDGNGLGCNMLKFGSAIQVRIYDKLREVRGDDDKCALMVERRWGGVLPEAATRVEFQVRRKPLRDRDVSSVEEVMAKLEHLVGWLTGKWFRVAEEKPDRENHHVDRCKASPLWETVVATFSKWIPTATKRMEKRRRLLPESKALKAQARGVLTTLAALSRATIEDAHDLMGFVESVLWASSKSMLEDLGLKRQKLAVLAACQFDLDEGDIPY
jgi:hypothetical protein